MLRVGYLKLKNTVSNAALYIFILTGIEREQEVRTLYCTYEDLQKHP